MPFDRCPAAEPPLAELMADPIVHALMRADHVSPREVERLAERFARRLRAPARPPSPAKDRQSRESAGPWRDGSPVLRG